MDGPDVSVIILNYKTPDLLRICVPSLQQQSFAHRMEIIVADNGSGDESVEVARSLGVRVIEIGHNAGFALGNNIAAQEARGRYVFFVNTDMRFDPRCVEALYERLVKEPGLFAADPLQYNWDGTRVIHGATRAYRGTMRNWLPGIRVNTVAQWEHPEYVAYGCSCFMVDAAIFRKLGGFDPTFFLDAEDLDICWRAWMRGSGTAFVPDARLSHMVGATADAPVRKQRTSVLRHASVERNVLRFALKNLPASKIPYVFASKLAVSLGLLALGRAREAATMWGALGSTILRMPQHLAARREVTRASARDRREVYARVMSGDVASLLGTPQG